MIDERPDPELESIRAEWEPPRPRPGFDVRVLRAYEREIGRVPWWKAFLQLARRWPVAAAVAAVGLLIAVVVFRQGGEARYQPVSQPHFIVVSSGEHP